jgi:serine/threonine-protein kinase RsbW
VTTAVGEAQEGTDVVELRLAGRPENIGLARLAANGVATVAGAPFDVVADLKLAVSEACTNVVRHAYRETGDREERPIILRFAVRRGEVCVEVEDEGCGFDSSNSVHPLSGLGMGLAIVRAVSDDVAVESGAGGSRVRFLKRF